MSTQLQPDQGDLPDQGGLKDRVTDFAQRKPGAFLAAAAAVGFVAARLLKRSSGDGGDDDGAGQALFVIPAEEWTG